MGLKIQLLLFFLSHAQVFIPCASLLLDVLDNPALQKKPKPSTSPPPSFALTIKLGKDLLDPRCVTPLRIIIIIIIIIVIIIIIITQQSEGTAMLHACISHSIGDQAMYACVPTPSGSLAQ
jgi:hypothetical protein